MKKEYPIHESAIVAQLLAFFAGGIDAYTYLTHGHVFALVQTGNLILLGINISKFNWTIALTRLIPIFVFFIGIMLTKYLNLKITHIRKFTRQEFILFIAIILIIIIAFLEDRIPVLFTSQMLSFTAAILLAEFDKLRGNPLTAFMMTGNMKKVATFLVEGSVQKKAELLSRSWSAAKLIIFFFVGAIINATLVKCFDFKTILFDALVLFIILLIIYINNRQILKKFTR